MSSVARAKQRYIQNRHDAYAKTTRDLGGVLGVDFSLVELSNRALEAIEKQWGKSHFDWAAINRKYNDPSCAKFAIWVGERLAAICVADTTGQSVKVRYLEGDPRGDCPLKGRRILVALDAMANYAQLRGKVELVLEPINEKLIDLYESVYGFEVVRPKKDPAFCRKKV